MKAKKYSKIIPASLKKYNLLVSSIVLLAGTSFSQSVYDNFEGNKILHYGPRTGVLDTLAKNPNPSKTDSSARCALYVRNGSKKFDNLKMNLQGKLSNVSSYSTYLGDPPKIKLKVYTNAPAGTLVEVLLGSKKGNNDYPAGTHSQYQAYTTVSNSWEVLEFKFSQIPQGSETPATQVDQLTLLFNPNSSSSDNYYFDEMTGPKVLTNSSETTVGTTNNNTPSGSPTNQPVKPNTNTKKSPSNEK